jgi:hypothetical protein
MFELNSLFVAVTLTATGQKDVLVAVAMQGTLDDRRMGR